MGFPNPTPGSPVLPCCLGSLQEQEHVPKAHSPGTEPKKQEHFEGNQNFPFPQPVPINKTRSDQELTPASPLHDQDKTPGAVVGAVPGSIHPHPLPALASPHSHLPTWHLAVTTPTPGAPRRGPGPVPAPLQAPFSAGRPGAVAGALPSPCCPPHGGSRNRRVLESIFLVETTGTERLKLLLFLPLLSFPELWGVILREWE